MLNKEFLWLIAYEIVTNVNGMLVIAMSFANIIIIGKLF